jgi:hypothetical protein
VKIAADRRQGLLSLLILFAADTGARWCTLAAMVSGIKFSRAPQYLSNAANKLRPQDVNYFPAQTFYGRVIFNFIHADVVFDGS